MTGVMLLPVSAAEVDGWPSDDRSPPHVGRNDGSEPSPFGDTINEEDQSSCDRPVIEKPQSLQLDKSPTWVASRSDSSYSWSSSVSNASDGAGRCLQSQLADRCRLLRKRRDYDPLIQWCIREGVSDRHVLQQHLDSSIVNRSQWSLANCDVESLRSISDVTCNRYDLFSEIVDDATPEDSDEDESDDVLGRIPDRFRPCPPDAILFASRAYSVRPSDASTSTAASDLFWLGVQIQQTRRKTTYQTQESPSQPIGPMPGKVVYSCASTPSTVKRLWGSKRQSAISEDVEIISNARGLFTLRRSRTLPEDTGPSPEESENGCVGDDGLDTCDGVISGSESDDTGSSAGDQVADLYGGGPYLVALKFHLQKLKGLQKAGVPMHFWPRMDSNAIGRRHTTAY